jgi:hypothetical protein
LVLLFGQKTNEIISGFLPWIFLLLPGDLLCDITNKKAYRKPQKASRKPPGRYKKFSGQKSRNNFVGFLSKQ